MNRIKARLKSIRSSGSVHVVEFVFCDEPLFMMSLELPDVAIEDEVTLGIKSTHIALAKNFDVRLSFLNQLKASVVAIEEGELLCGVRGAVCGVILEAIVTTKAYRRMQLQIGDSVVMLLPASEIYIAEK